MKSTKFDKKKKSFSTIYKKGIIYTFLFFFPCKRQWNNLAYSQTYTSCKNRPQDWTFLNLQPYIYNMIIEYCTGLYQSITLAYTLAIAINILIRIKEN